MPGTVLGSRFKEFNKTESLPSWGNQDSFILWIHSLSKYLLRIYLILGTIVSAEEMIRKRPGSWPYVTTISWGRQVFIKYSHQEVWNCNCEGEETPERGTFKQRYNEGHAQRPGTCPSWGWETFSMAKVKSEGRWDEMRLQRQTGCWGHAGPLFL